MRCKPGILAYVIAAGHEHQDCIGRVVKVISWDIVSGRWLVSFEGKTPQSIQQALRTSLFGVEVLCYDDCLRPLSGLKVDEEIKQEECV